MTTLKPKQSILLSLIENGACSVSELTKLTSYSRVTLSKELEILLDSEILRKDGTKYLLNDTASFSIFKMHSNRAESLCFKSGSKTAPRKQTELLYSLTYRDNVTFHSTNVQKAFSSELNSARYPFLCIVCDESIDTSNIISKKFSVRKLRSNLVAKYLSYKYSNQSVLYLNGSDGFSALCFEGSCLGTSSKADKNISENLKSCFEIFKPHTVVLEGEPNDNIADLCRKEKIDFCFLSDAGGLYIDEKQLMLDCLCEI